MKFTKLFILAALFTACCARGGFTGDERALIGNDPGAGPMRVLVVGNPDDSLFLRRMSAPLTKDDVRSPYFDNLCRRMLATVTDPAQDGVGIAAVQTGVSRAVIAVKRLDKQGEPLEFYVNPRITAQADSLVPSQEGCLSVPGRSGRVMREEWIRITYNDPATFEEKHEDIHGFTAIIFQHEIDHLHGRLYTDLLIEDLQESE